MKKWIKIYLAVMLIGLIFWSCSDDDNTTEPTNNAPVITSITASATSVLQGGICTLNCSASDADPGDVLTYTWTKTGGTLSSTTGTSTVWTTPTTVGTYTVTVTVSDGVATDTDSKAITVTDYTPPSGMVYVQGGTFPMGDHFDPEGDTNELPVHSVTLSDFYIGATEVTQAEWTAVMGSNPASGDGVGDIYPVYYVSWYAIMKYCNLRSMNDGLTPCYTISSSTDPAVWGTIPTSSNSTWNAATCNWSANGYRLPSEAEWEYAARGGIHDADNLRYSGCQEYADLMNFAWFGDNSTGASHPVGTKLPNQLGLYDMSGNLWEWCWDWYGSFASDSVTNPYGPTTGTFRVLRGSGWYYAASSCRVAYRGDFYPYSIRNSFGFRLSRTP